MISYCPAPRWRTLAGALRMGAYDDATLTAPWRREGDSAHVLSRSMWSLAAIVVAWVRFHPGRRPQVWIPSYFCHSVLAPLERTCATIVFYPITPALEPDFMECRRMANVQRPDIFLLAHFFGSVRDAKTAREFCRLAGAWLVEDCAHVLLPWKGVGESGDFVLYSPHKHLALPDGAVLVVRPEAAARSSAAGESLAKVLAEIVARMSREPNGVSRWLINRAAQKLGIGTVRPGRTTNPEEFNVDPSGMTVLPRPGLGRYSRCLLARSLRDLPEVRVARNRNHDLWLHLLGRTLPRTETSPAAYFASVSEENNLAAARKFAALKSTGFPVRSWPDLPPAVRAADSEHGVARQLRDTKVMLEVHQGICPSDILKLFPGKTAADGVAGQATSSIEWVDGSPAEWNVGWSEIEKASLTQSMGYGNAKRHVERWTVRRGFVHVNGQRVAVFQCLAKTIGGLRVVRINRGPLLLAGVGEDALPAVYRAIGQIGCWWKRRVLLIAPELENSPASVVFLTQLGYRFTASPAWSSSWIDLGLELTELKRRLDGKWRNQLGAAEKRVPSVEVTERLSDLEWLATENAAYLRTKGLVGLAPEFLRALAENSPPEERPLVIKALYDEKPVAGIVIARHARAATYLIGWSGPEGRKIYANQLLLWTALEYLKANGYKWFDLGGIDYHANVRVADFKNSMGGSTYDLVGEFIKY